MTVEHLPISEIVPYRRNPRIHPQPQIDLLKRSIHEYGWTVPVLLDSDNVVIAGHGRLEAAKQLGLDTVPVIRRDDLTVDQVKAYRIADNRLTEIGEWNDDLVRDELAGLKGSGLLIADDPFLAGYDIDSAPLSLDTPEPLETPPEHDLRTVSFQVPKDRVKEFHERVDPIHAEFT